MATDPLPSAVAFDTALPWGSFAPRPWQRALLAACHAIPGAWAALYRLVFALRKPIKYGDGRPLDVTIWGHKLRLLPRGNMSEIKLLFAPQFFDRDELALLARHLRPGATFIDIGANVGVYSFWAARLVGQGGRILAVEPDPEMRRRLEFNLQSNACTQVEVCPVALSDHQGEGELLVNPAQRGENTLARVEAAAAGGERVVQRVTLDTLVHLLVSRGVTSVDALKIDIEGHEPVVLGHFFAHADPALWPRLAITEFKRETAQAIEDQFVACGYRRVLSNGLNLAFERPA
jgi:FkbM family methyltransferase